jgi:hypothetical protein
MATTAERRHISLRIADEDLSRIDELAEEHGLTRTDYMIRVCTGQLEDPYRFEDDLCNIKVRLLRLERVNGVLPAGPSRTDQPPTMQAAAGSARAHVPRPQPDTGGG